ncbi:protein D2 [Bemisia tabaci]|uniref:protein D2 n=1 Tax=Bemisia tabaci TaxID=7038 RepID=UPI003B28BF40
MTVNDIVGDVIECTPQFGLRRILVENIVDYGNIIDSTDCLSPPVVVEWPAEKDAYYTLSLVGPDYPSRYNRTENTEWNYWLVANIFGNKWSKGEVLAEYIGPHLFKNLGFHRYVFLVYRQPIGAMKFDEPHLDNTINDKARGKFCIRKFAAKYGLGLL